VPDHTEPEPAETASTESAAEEPTATGEAAATAAEPVTAESAEPPEEKAAAPEEKAVAPARPAIKLPSRLVFKVPMVALVVLAFVVVCESTVALALPWFSLLYLIPLVGAVWVLRTRTVIDSSGLLVRRMFTRRLLPWTEVASLRVREGKWLAAVLADGSEVTLPEVRTRHLPVLSLITGGRIADLTEPAQQATREPDSDEAATAAGTAETGVPAAAGEAADAPVEGSAKQSGRTSDQPV
jgi:hypothetical protein